MFPLTCQTHCLEKICCLGSARVVPNLRAGRYVDLLTKLMYPQVRADGMVINTMGWVDNLGYDLLLHSIKALKADVVIVVGQDRLHSQLRSELRSEQDSKASLLMLQMGRRR